jgi:hypothetical protein
MDSSSDRCRTNPLRVVSARDFRIELPLLEYQIFWQSKILKLLLVRLFYDLAEIVLIRSEDPEIVLWPGKLTDKINV